jgi:hypothetical protein
VALIPRRGKNTGESRSVQERAGMTLLNLSEARAAIDERLKREAKARAKKEAQNATVVAEAVAPQLFTLTTGDAEDPAFRRITSPATLRDLNPLMHDRMTQVCYFLRVTTPFGKRIVEIITSYVVGKGVRFTAKEPAVQEVLKNFWDDPVNKMDATTREWCDELTTFGELCIPLAVNEVAGTVRLGYVDPMNIDTIQFSEMKSKGGMIGITLPYAVHLRKEVGEAVAPPVPLVRTIDDPADPRYGQMDGECFYFAINKAKSASRGFSELFSLADWIDVFDQMIFDFADKARFLNSYVWHYTLEGGDDKKVAELKDKLTKNPPRQGGVQVTNEKVKIEAQTPQFHGADMAEGARMVKLYGLGGAGLPAWFFADPVDANRSTAQEMQGPTGKKIEDRQNHLGECLQQVLNFVLDKAITAGVLPESIDRTFQLEFPELAVRDLVNGATTLQSVSTSLVTGVQEGWIRNETAARAFHTVLSEIGVDIDDSKAEYELAQEEVNDRAAQQQNSIVPQSQLATALNQIPKLTAGKLPNDKGTQLLEEQADPTVQLQ